MDKMDLVKVGVPVGLAIGLECLRGRRPVIAFEVRSSIRLVAPNQAAPGAAGLSFAFNGEPVDDPHVCEIVVKNVGPGAVRAFERRLRLDLGTRILQSECLSTSGVDEPLCDDSVLAFGDRPWNEGDKIVLRLVTASAPLPTPKWEGRVVDADIGPLATGRTPLAWVLRLAVNAFFVGLACLVVYFIVSSMVEAGLRAVAEGALALALGVAAMVAALIGLGYLLSWDRWPDGLRARVARLGRT